MKILVTGAGGFLGSRIVERLLEHGQTDIRCMLRDRSKASKLEGLQVSYPKAKLDIRFGNLKNKADAIEVLEGVSLVIHAASAMKGGAADMFLDSVVASRNLLEAIAERKQMRVVLVSSFGVLAVSDLGRGALVNEETPTESHPERRDIYSHSKLRQEQIFWEYQEKFGFELVVLRPGVVYGPGGGHFSGRVGLNLFGIFLHLGGKNNLPLTYVDNAAEAIVVAALHPQSGGQIYHVSDDETPSSRQYLRAYKREVRPMRSVRVPYFALMALSRAVEWYHRYSKGQLPAVFTPYKTRAMWGGNRFSNAKLHSIGWKQLISTEEGLRRSFEAFRRQA